MHEPIYIQCVKSSLEKARRGFQLSHREIGERGGMAEKLLISQLTSYITSMGLLEDGPGVMWKKGQVSSPLGQMEMGS